MKLASEWLRQDEIETRGYDVGEYLSQAHRHGEEVALVLLWEDFLGDGTETQVVIEGDKLYPLAFGPLTREQANDTYTVGR